MSEAQSPVPISNPVPDWELTGPATAPVVAVLGGISAGRHVTTAGRKCEPGWWEAIAGPSRAVDIDQVRVLGIEWVVSPDCPTTTADQADALAAVLDHLDIPKLEAIVGSSYGGMVALAFAEQYPDRVDRVAVIAAAHRSHPMATAHRVIQRRIIALGREAGRVLEGIALARALAVTGYRTAVEFDHRFDSVPNTQSGSPVFEIEGYLDHQGNRFASTWQPERYLALSESLDTHSVDPGQIKVPLAVLGFTSDSIVPPWLLHDLADRAGGECSLELVDTRYGHDAFLKECATVAAFLTSALGQEVRCAA